MLLKTVTFAFIFAVASQAWAIREGGFCETLLGRDVAKTINEVPVVAAIKRKPFTNVRGETKWDSQASAEVTGRLVHEDGRREYIITKIGESWYSSHTPYEADNAPQGDPRAIVQTLGGELAAFFGFYYVDAKTFVAPDMKFFNKRIDQLNIALVKLGYEKIPVRFYMTEEMIVDDAEYNRQFVDHGGIPISSDLTLFLHDLAFHLGTIVFPADFLKATIQVGYAQDLFVKFITAKAQKSDRKKALMYEYVRETLESIQTQKSDILLGSFVELYRGSLTKEVQDDEDDMPVGSFERVVVMGAYFGEFKRNRSATFGEMLRHRVEETFFEVGYTPKNREDHMSDDEILKLLKNDLTKFMKQPNPVDWKAQILPGETAHGFEGAPERIDELKRALRIITKPNRSVEN